jgi:hypothetical protein
MREEAPSYEVFVPVPKNLEKEANQILGELDSTVVDMTKETPLVAWAKQHHAKKSNKKAMQKASKKRNR